MKLTERFHGLLYDQPSTNAQRMDDWRQKMQLLANDVEALEYQSFRARAALREFASGEFPSDVRALAKDALRSCGSGWRTG